jgi:hypothetical protein
MIPVDVVAHFAYALTIRCDIKPGSFESSRALEM